MTHSHALDLALVTAALPDSRFPYVGLIGSATKRALFERRLAEFGVAADAIARLVCPIGVPGISGKSPSVIAAAVAAELLLVRERANATPKFKTELALG
jgi:xanthine dehydrogenase accessory factor